MTNKRNTVIYIGVTSDLRRRVFEHKESLIEGFTSKYKCTKLVWYEETGNIISAIEREKQMKGWKREYKVNVINLMNKEWADLYNSLG